MNVISLNAVGKIIETPGPFFRVILPVMLLCGFSGLAAEIANSTTAPVVRQRILVRPKAGVNLAGLHASLGVRSLAKFSAIENLEILEVPAGISADALISNYQQSGMVRYAERDHSVRALLEPNDPYFVSGALWQLKNYGQSGGVADADIDAPEAWETGSSADNIIVCIMDSGVRYTHQDLAPNMWRNPGEIAGNQTDDDGNGYVDDVHGINAVTGSGNPSDDRGHGTHVAGIVGARGFNGLGGVGVCWSVQLMACKFVDAQGNALISDAIKCMDYARAKGAKVINFSWGEIDFDSQALYDAISSLRSAGIIFTAACGNESLNNDVYPLYPASYNLDNIISVAATTRTDELASYSCYGPNSVDLGAPGDAIFSCWYTADFTYQYLSGTSMSAPVVAGACALIWARHPEEDYAEIIHRVLANVDPLPGLVGKCVTGGRLNLQKAITAPGAVPDATVSVQASDNVATIGTSDTAAFKFSRVGNSDRALTINFELGGSAVKWDDYRRPEGDMPEFFTIPAGSSSATMTIVALGNESGANPQTVSVSLREGSGYLVGSPVNAMITIYPEPELFIRDIRLVSPSSMTISWSSVPGWQYQVQYRTDPLAGIWQNAGAAITASSTITTWTNSVPKIGQRFYIVKRISPGD